MGESIVEKKLKYVKNQLKWYMKERQTSEGENYKELEEEGQQKEKTREKLESQKSKWEEKKKEERKGGEKRRLSQIGRKEKGDGVK